MNNVMNTAPFQADWVAYGVGLAMLIIVAQALVLRRKSRAGASTAVRAAPSSATASSPVTDKPRKSFLNRHGPALTALFTITLLYLGWQNREFSYLDAESGVGYALGIIGGVMMLVLLLYPVRKKWRPMKRLGAVKHWFRMHMIMGVAGPVTIVFHSNFKLGSMNSNVALYCMLLVAGSGLIGRYIYKKIHNGLYGKKTSLEELKSKSMANKGKLAHELQFSSALKRRLQVFEKAAINPERGVLKSFIHVLFFRFRLLWAHFTLLRLVKEGVKQEGQRTVDTVLVHHWSDAELRRHTKDAKRYLKTYLTMLRRIDELHLFERMFSLWHVLHYPFFLMMVVSAIVHTIAVHMY